MTRNIQTEPLKAPEFVLDLLIPGGALSVRSLCLAGEIMQVGEIAIRVALTRLCRQGKVRQAGRGRYEIDPNAGPLMRDVEDWRNRERQMVHWRGLWVAVHDTAVPRSDKTAWRHHSLALKLRGFAEFQPGLHLRPDNLSGGVAALRLQLAELGLSRLAHVFCVTEFSDAQLERAASLWEIGHLERKYDALARHLDARRAFLSNSAGNGALRESLLLGREAIGIILRDPLLPVDLMAAEHRRMLVAATLRYQNQARQLWREWLASVD
ncbi:PaaX family transcriptional regulator [Burkholderia guangdongensis]|uniref:PaaX family transcriptional regulator n=1 Tax=Burkholderia guangdongensis TaxID=1792500 RepID=UPI0015C81939|nr:PaaX family transcriptional regulator [Burkholderia guangdongensis]